MSSGTWKSEQKPEVVACAGWLAHRCSRALMSTTETPPLSRRACSFRVGESRGGDSKVSVVPSVEPYVPGEFYRRELPCILRVLETISESIDVIVVDGYVWLEGTRPGLGAHLFDTLGTKVAIICVAKDPSECGGR
jgi:hypothetical protein